MKIHCLQHVSFEGPAAIAEWANKHNHTLTYTRFYNNELPPISLNFDLLVIMGGPMSFDDDEKYSWMCREKEFIKKAILAGKAAIGICLGAQFLAQALGAEAKHGTTQEVGWFPVNFKNLPSSLKELPSKIPVFHWHEDTFEIPQGAVHIASTTEFPNQGFIWKNKVAALQFHLEVTPESVAAMIENVGHEITPGTYCQTPTDILAEQTYFEKNIAFLSQILDAITAHIDKS